MIKLSIFFTGIGVGIIICCIGISLKSPTEHICHEKEYRDAFCKCNSERMEVQNIIKRNKDRKYY